MCVCVCVSPKLLINNFFLSRIRFLDQNVFPDFKLIVGEGTRIQCTQYAHTVCTHTHMHTQYAHTVCTHSMHAHTICTHSMHTQYAHTHMHTHTMLFYINFYTGFMLGQGIHNLVAVTPQQGECWREACERLAHSHILACT